ncbi:MAG: hypothetical protein ACLTW6_03755 [Enterobacter sp.]
MPDEVRSKLLKALGYTLRLTDNVESLTAAVEYLRQAAVLNPKKAGVTRDIELLQRALKKSGQLADGDGADAKPEANSTETQTATPPTQPKAKRETKKPAAKSKPAAKKRTTDSPPEGGVITERAPAHPGGTAGENRQRRVFVLPSTA